MATQERGSASMDHKAKHQGQAQGGKPSQAGGNAQQFAGQQQAHEAGKKSGHRSEQDKHQMADTARKGGKH